MDRGREGATRLVAHSVSCVPALASLSLALESLASRGFCVICYPLQLQVAAHVTSAALHLN